MEQHPVPQHIASYEFRLVGDMTLKQFGFLAIGGGIALAFYAFPFPWYFKWPGIIFSGALGVAFAFMPIQERPLSQWVTSFIKAVFSPTQFLWEKRAKELEVFKATPKKQITKAATVSPPDQFQLKEYLETLPQRGGILEQHEEGHLKQIMNLFHLTKVPTVTPTASTPSPVPPVPPPTSYSPSPKPTVFRPKHAPAIRTARPVPPRVKSDRPVVLPEKPGRPREISVEAKISPYLPIPAPPTIPNILVGMVLDKDDSMVEGAILEIRNNLGIPVRALKTNKLGQFRIATPLENGTYEIEVEKEGYQFDIIKIELKGAIIQPLEIRTKNSPKNVRPS